MDTPATQGQQPPATAPAPAPKYYLAKAVERKPVGDAKPQTVEFVVAGPDYKSAWQTARQVTAKGTDKFVGDVWADVERKTELKMDPADFTVESLTSLQPRSNKVTPLTLDQVETALLADDSLSTKDKDRLKEALTKLRTVGPVGDVTPPAAGADADNTDNDTADKGGGRRSDKAADRQEKAA